MPNTQRVTWDLIDVLQFTYTMAKGRNTSGDTLGRYEMLSISILSVTETSEDYRRLILLFGKSQSAFRGLELNVFAQ